MKFIRYIPLFVLILLLFSGCTIISSNTSAVGGFIDLSESRFDEQLATLNGEWDFYPEQWIANDEIKAGSHKAEKLKIPGLWEPIFNRLLKKKSIRFGTLHLKIRLPENHPDKLALQFNGSYSSCRIYVNESLVVEQGRTGDQPLRDLANYVGFTFNLPDTQGNEFDLVIQLASYNHLKGGIDRSVYLGKAGILQKTQQLEYMIQFATLVVFFCFGFFFIVGFGYRTNEKSLLYFALFCLCIGFRSLINSDFLYYYFLPDFQWEIARRLSLCSLVGIWLLNRYIDYLYRKAFNRWIIRIYDVVTVLYLISVLTIPIPQCYWGVFLYLAIGIIICGYAMYKQIFFMIKRVENSIIIGVGFLIMYLFVIHDLLFFVGVVYEGFMVEYGLFLFVSIETVALTRQYASSFNRIARLSQSLKASQQEIAEYNLTLEQKVAERTEEVKRQQLELDKDIILAKKIQDSLLPPRIPHIHNADFAYEYVPMMKVGGDFLDFYYDKENMDLSFYICDVSGHGVHAAFLATMVKMSLQFWGNYLDQPVRNLEKILDTLRGKMSGNYITLCMCYLNLHTGRLVVASAGHPPMLICRKNGELEVIRSNGHVLNDNYPLTSVEIELMLAEGDRVVLYTDGFVESRNADLEMYGEEKFYAKCHELSGNPPQVFCKKMFEELYSFTGHEGAGDDDLTILMLEYKGNNLKNSL